MKRFKVIFGTACALVLVSLLHVAQCSDSGVAPSAPRSPALATVGPTSRSTRLPPPRPVWLPILRAFPAATAFADFLKTAAAAAHEPHVRPIDLRQLPAVLRALARAIEVVAPPPHPPQETNATATTANSTPAPATTSDVTSTPAPATTSDATSATGPAATSTRAPTPSPPTITSCPPSTGASYKKLMSLFVPTSVDRASPTASPPSAVTLPRLFRKADSFKIDR